MGRFINNPNAIHILEKNLDKVCFQIMSINPNAIHLISKLDYDRMKNEKFQEELIEYIHNPNRLLRLCKQYDISFEELVEFY